MLTVLSGIKSNVLIGVGVAFLTLVIAVGILFNKVLTLKEEKGVIEATLNQKTQDVIDLNTELERLRKENVRVNGILMENREKSISNTAASVAKESEMRKVYETDAPSREWRDHSIPRAVIDILLAD